MREIFAVDYLLSSLLPEVKEEIAGESQ